MPIFPCSYKTLAAFNGSILPSVSFFKDSMKLKETTVTKVCRPDLKCILKEEHISTYLQSISVYQQVSCIESTQVLIKYHLVNFSLQQSFLCNLENFPALASFLDNSHFLSKTILARK